MRPHLRHLSMIHRVTIIVTIVVAVVLLAGFASGYGQPILVVARRFGDLRPVPLAVGTAVSGLAMWNRGWMNQVAHEAVDVRCGAAEMTRTAAVGFAAQKLVKSAGAAGLAVFVRHGRRRGHPTGAVVAACVLTAAAAFLALGGLVAITIVTLVATGRLTGWWIAAGVGFSVWASVIVVGAVVVMRSRAAAVWIWDRAQRLRRRPAAPMPSGWFDALDLGRRRPAALVRLLGHAVLGKLLGACVLTAALAATGLDVGPTEALIIYATALSASVASIVPGGVGVVEGSLVALLVAGGAAAGSAVLAVAVFRVLDLWLPVVAGCVVARGEISRREPEVEGATLAHVDADPRPDAVGGSRPIPVPA